MHRDDTTYEPGTLAHQFRALLGVFLDPAGAFGTLPPRQLYPIALLIPLSVGLCKIVAMAGWQRTFGTVFSSVLYLGLGVAIQFGIVWMVRLTVQLFGKSLDYFHVFNIYGYAQAPALLGAIAVVLANRVPISADPGQGSTIHALVMFFNLFTVVYSLGLLVFAFRWAPRPGETPPSPPPAE